MRVKMYSALIGLFFTSLSFGQSYEWSSRVGGQEADIIYDVAFDNEGNIYSVGFFEETVDFNPGGEVLELTSLGNRDGFVQKLDEENNLIWVKQFGGSENIYIRSIAVDETGNIYVTGNFRGTIDFDPGIGVFEMTAALDTKNAFTVKLDALGDLVWAKQIMAAPQSSGHIVAVDQSGNVYTGGDFTSEMDIDPGIDEFVFSVAGEGKELFIQKLNSSGELVWGRQFEGTDFTECHINGLEIDQLENVYLAGYFQGTVDFDPEATVVEISSTPGEIIGQNSRDIFIGKLNPLGSLNWIKQYGSLKDDRAYSMTLDSTGNVLVTGSFRDTVVFETVDGPVELVVTGSGLGFGDPGGTDVFVQKLNTTGDLLWVKQMKGQDEVSFGTANAISSDVFGNVYIAGEFYNGTLDFDPGLGEELLTAVGGGVNAFIQKIDASGNLVWAKQIAGNEMESFIARPFGIAVSSNNSIAVAGYFQGEIDFDSEKSVDIIESSPLDGFDGFIVYFVQGVTGITDNGAPLFANVYPNPTTGELIIKCNTLNETCTISIYSSSGQLLNMYQSNDIISTVNLSDYASGLFIVEVSIDDAINRFRIVKK